MFMKLVPEEKKSLQLMGEGLWGGGGTDKFLGEYNNLPDVFHIIMRWIYAPMSVICKARLALLVQLLADTAEEVEKSKIWE